MKQILFLVVAAATIVYAGNANAQMDPNMSAGMTPAPVVSTTMNPVASAPKPMKAPEPAAMRVAPKPAMAPEKPMPAPVAPAMVPTPMEAPKPAAAPEKPAESPTKAAQPKESGWDKADKWIGRLEKVAWAVVLLVFAILGVTSKKEWAKNKRLQNLTKMALDNYGVVEKLAGATGWKGDDKLAQLFKRILLQTQAEGQKPLSAEEKAHVSRVVADKAAADKIENGDDVDPEKVTEKTEG